MASSGIIPILRHAELIDTTANWTTNNPVLLKGEIGFDETINDFKVGDGVSDWNSLPYYLQGVTVTLPIPYEIYQTGTINLAEDPAPASTVPLNTEVDAVTGYSQSGGGAQVTEAGTYKYSYSVSGDGTDNDRGTIVASIYVNGAELLRTRSYAYARNVNNGEGTAAKSGKLILGANDVVTVRSFIFGDNVTTIDQASNLVLEKKA